MSEPADAPWLPELRELARALDPADDERAQRAATFLREAADAYERLRAVDLAAREDTEVLLGQLELLLVGAMDSLFRFLGVAAPDDASDEERALIAGARELVSVGTRRLQGEAVDDASAAAHVSALRAEVRKRAAPSPRDRRS